MSWITNFVRPKIQALMRRNEVPGVARAILKKKKLEFL